MTTHARSLLALSASLLLGCGSAAQSSVLGGVVDIPVAPGVAPSSPSVRHHVTTAPKIGAPIDARAVASATGVEKPDVDGSVVKVSFPRTDVGVAVDGWKLPPFMGLTSWVSFGPAREGIAEAMIMGDLVLFEDEVSSVMSALLDGGVEVTALHNHFFFDQPRVYFMHVGGEGAVKDLGKTVKAAMDKVSEVRKKTPKPASTFNVAGTLAAKSTLDGAKLEAAFGGRTGTARDGMWKLVVGRDVTSSCGCPAGKSMGVTTWAAFAGTEDGAVVDGDFAVTEAELQPVLRELRGGGVHVVAIHHHMSGETPRLLFVHFWGRGKAADLAGVVKRALDRTASSASSAA